MYKGIKILSGFDVKSATPIDIRSTKNTLEEMESMKNVYDGLFCFCKDTKKPYLYTDGKWDDKVFGSGGLANDTNTVDDYLIRT